MSRINVVFPVLVFDKSKNEVKKSWYIHAHLPLKRYGSPIDVAKVVYLSDLSPY